MLHNTLKNPAGVDAPDGAKTDIYFNVQDDHQRPGRQPRADAYERWTLAAEAIRSVFAEEGGAS